MGRHILERCRSLRVEEFGMEQGLREAQELVIGRFVYVMYHMQSGLQPENNLLFLLFPY